MSTDRWNDNEYLLLSLPHRLSICVLITTGWLLVAVHNLLVMPLVGSMLDNSRIFGHVIHLLDNEALEFVIPSNKMQQGNSKLCSLSLDLLYPLTLFI